MPSLWWVCFHCWVVYYLPTTGYYGDCPQCGKPTRPWHVDPMQSLRMTEWLRPARTKKRAEPPPSGGAIDAQEETKT